MIKLLSTDFDGTLVDHYAQAARRARALRAAPRAAAARACSWAVNTGRELVHMEEGLREFDFPIEPDFVLTSEREVFHRGPDGGWKDFGDWNARCYQAHDELFAQAEPLLADVRAFLKREVEAQPDL